MTNISRHNLPQKNQIQLFSQFTNLFIAADEKKLSAIFDALFSESEKIMFIKRVAIVLMISKGASLYAIEKTLRVSNNTVRSHKKFFDEGRYDVLVGITKSKKFDIDKFFAGIDDLLRLGMPSYGKDRWKWKK